MSKTRRIQLSRKKGFKLPANTIVVSRPTKWGNPVKKGDWFGGHQITQEDAVNWYRDHITPDSLMGKDARKELRGKNLACWCKPGTPCHADVLLELANK